MKAIDIQDGELVWTEVDEPAVGPREVLIRNHATAVNRADLVQRQGRYPPPPGESAILGLECAGVVEEVGEEVAVLRPGDEVCALLGGGGYAEKVVVDAGQALPIPKGLSLVDAAALPEVFATAYLNLYMEAALTPGERALVHAGASGVGTAAIQLCDAFGNPCYVTVGSSEKLERCIALGASGGCNRHAERFRDHVEAWTDGNGFDAILDPVGAGYLADNLRALGTDGRLVLIGLLGGTTGEIELGLMLVKRLRLIGSTLRARPVAAKAEVMAALQQWVWPLIERGRVQPVIEVRIPLPEAERAHQLIASNETFGKVLLTL